jgi:hypothetical protein
LLGDKLSVISDKLVPQRREVEQNHTDSNQNANDCPADAYPFFVVFAKHGVCYN